EPTFAPGDLREELERSRDAAPAPRESIVFERFLERFPCRGSLALVEEDLPQAEERVGEDEAVPSVLDREGDDLSCARRVAEAEEHGGELGADLRGDLLRRDGERSL